jgi:nucleoside-diphosphate-sugar epimerase
MRVLIAGASGAIGRALVRRLRANQHEVFALTQSRDSAAVLKEIGAELWHRARGLLGGDGVRVWQITSEDRRATWEATAACPRADVDYPPYHAARVTLS